jgi:hypothetical protein
MIRCLKGPNLSILLFLSLFNNPQKIDITQQKKSKTGSSREKSRGLDAMARKNHVGRKPARWQNISWLRKMMEQDS